MPQSSTLGALSAVVLSFLRFGVAFVPPVHNQVQQQLKDPAAVLVVHNVQDDASRRSLGSISSTSTSSTSTSTSTGSTSSTSHGGAKESFLRNLERNRAGEDVPSSILDADLARLWSTTTTPEHDSTTTTATTATTVDNLDSWRGRWRICHAPHIDTLGGLILTSFPSVEYNFLSSDGRMVSHSRYESKVFGSGWFNADGRVVPLKQQNKQEPRTGDSSVVSGVVRPKDEEVQVIFERFWWDRNGEDRPTEAPPSAAGGEVSLGGAGAASSSGGFVDRFVQVAGQSMFFGGLSVFPVRYLDDDLCVFEFKAAGTVVASQRIQ